MKTIKMHGTPAFIFGMNQVLGAILVCFSYVAIDILYTELYHDNAVFAGIMIVFTSTVFLVLPLIFMVRMWYRFLTVFTFSPEGITIKYPFQNRKMIPTNQITMMGAVQFAGRFMFFLSEDVEKMETFYYAHEAECRKLFREALINKFSNYPEGRMKLALGVYLRKTRHVDCLEFTSLYQLEKIVNLLNKPAILTGALLQKEEEYHNLITPRQNHNMEK